VLDNIYNWARAIRLKLPHAALRQRKSVAAFGLEERQPLLHHTESVPEISFVQDRSSA